MPDEFVAKIGYLRIAEHILAKYENESHVLEADLQVMNSFEQISDSLAKDEIDGGFLPLPLALDFFRKGMEIKLLLLVNGNKSVFFKTGNADIKKIKDFKGKSILTPCFLSVHNMLLHQMFFTAGLKLGSSQDKTADVFLEVVPSNIMLEFIENDSDNDVGGFVASDPFSSEILQEESFKTICKLESLWAGYPDTVFVMKNRLLQENSQYVSKLIDSITLAGDIADHDDLICFAKPSSYFSSVEIVQNYMVDKAGFLPEKADIKAFIDKKYIEKSTDK